MAGHGVDLGHLLGASWQQPFQAGQLRNFQASGSRTPVIGKFVWPAGLKGVCILLECECEELHHHRMQVWGCVSVEQHAAAGVACLLDFQA